MGLFDQFPYTNFHELNLNWIIAQIKSIKDAAKSTAADAAIASESAASAAASAGSAGNSAALVQQVRDDLDTVNTEMTNFIQAHSGLSNETVLWTGTASATGTTITLSDDIRNYKYIDVMATYRGAVSSSSLGTFPGNVIRFTPEDFTEHNAVLNIPYAYDDQLQICTVFMFWDSTDPTDYTKVSLGYNRRVSINDQGVLTNADDPGTVIVKILGVKNISDAEVIDARVGEDNTVYPTLKQRLDAEYLDLQSAIASTTGMNAEFKVALETLVNNIIYKGNDPTGRTYINALHNAMYPPADLDSISAVYTQTGVVYNDASLDSLKNDLVVTAHYSDSTSATVLGYTLSGTLTVGTSIITVTYEGKTTTFAVTVTENPLIYSLLNHVCNGTADTIVTTDILLFNQDQDFTILLNVTTTGQNATPTWRLVDAIRSTDNIQRGISLVEYDSTHAMLRLGESTVQFTEFSRSYSGQIKFAIRHTVGSGVGKIKIKPANSSAVEYTTSPVVAFSPSTDRPLSFGGNYSRTNVFRGTISAYVYNTVLTDAEVNDFLGV